MTRFRRKKGSVHQIQAGTAAGLREVVYSRGPPRRDVLQVYGGDPAPRTQLNSPVQQRGRGPRISNNMAGAHKDTTSICRVLLGTCLPVLRAGALIVLLRTENEEVFFSLLTSFFFLRSVCVRSTPFLPCASRFLKSWPPAKCLTTSKFHRMIPVVTYFTRVKLEK